MKKVLCVPVLLASFAVATAPVIAHSNYLSKQQDVLVANCRPELRSQGLLKHRRLQSYGSAGDKWQVQGFIRNWSDCPARGVRIQIEVNKQDTFTAYIDYIPARDKVSFTEVYFTDRPSKRMKFRYKDIY